MTISGKMDLNKSRLLSKLFEYQRELDITLNQNKI